MQLERMPCSEHVEIVCSRSHNEVRVPATSQSMKGIHLQHTTILAENKCCTSFAALPLIKALSCVKTSCRKVSPVPAQLYHAYHWVAHHEQVSLSRIPFNVSVIEFCCAEKSRNSAARPLCSGVFWGVWIY